MRLVTAQAKNYRSIDDSSPVSIGAVTCLVGKNESGKTAFLKALHGLDPVDNTFTFDEVIDYPSKDYARYKKVRDKQPAEVIRCTFELTEPEISGIEAEFGAGVLITKRFDIYKTYRQSGTSWSVEVDEEKAVKHLAALLDVPSTVRDKADALTTVGQLRLLLEGVQEANASVQTVLEKINGYREGRLVLAVLDTLKKPKFFYFDDYSVMRGRVSIPYLLRRRDAKTLEDHERTFLALLEIAGTKLEDFQNPGEFERLTRELEAAGNAISQEVFKFWSQNQQLRVTFQVSQADPTDPPPLNEGPVLNVRVWNERHRVSVPFDERSRGFVWFFSFFAYFSQLDFEAGSVVLLLDEPGLSLHATAQADFLKFIDEKLAPDHQVIYTTHSPFMIPASHLDRVRTVEDTPADGSTISAEVFRTDAETIFPLQAALGYDLAQTLFVGPNCLLVEGPSDLIYLQLLSHAARENGNTGLDDRWVVVPVGGADKLSTFVSLLGGNQLNTAVVIDISANEKQRIANLQANGHLGNNALIQIGDITGAKNADIEDLFEPDFYLELVNAAYGSAFAKPLTAQLIANGDPRIVQRVGAYFGTNGLGEFNHYRPAAAFLQGQVQLLPKLSANTLNHVDDLFSRLNRLLPT